jgi:putative FmdB family regulatory protein
MPLYDFKCRKCGKKFEELVRVGGTADCPKCGAGDAERLFSMTAGVSTDKTRKRTTAIARRRAGAVKKEQDHAQREYERNYIKDHS